MKKATPALKAAIFTGLLLASPLLSRAQYFWDYGVHAGAANYLGDMGGNELTRRDFVSDLKMSETNFSAGGFVRYKINPMFSVKADLDWARISGDDKLSSNPGRNGRNLSFRNDVISAAGELEFCFYDLHDLGHTYRYANAFRAYLGLGAGVAYHNPKTMYNGDWVALRPLETEGKSYTKVTAIIPATAGFYFTLNKHYRIGWNITWNTTFTDYLDDVSTRYADPSTLSSPLSAALANRTDELNVSPAFAENFTPGNKRGDPTHNDSYLTTNIDMGYVIRGHSQHQPGSNISTRPLYDWIHDTPSKYDGPSHRPNAHVLLRRVLRRTHRYHW